MSWRRAAVVAALCAATAANACELVLSEQRGARELLRLPLPAAAPHPFEIAFEHSVLGTTVVDRYEPRGDRAHLVEERFSGNGYGLPYAATAPGETLRREADGWRLQLDRAVDPLVVRPLRAQRMRLRVGQREVLLADLSDRAIDVRATGCSPALR